MTPPSWLCATESAFPACSSALMVASMRLWQRDSVKNSYQRESYALMQVQKSLEVAR